MGTYVTKLDLNNVSPLRWFDHWLPHILYFFPILAIFCFLVSDPRTRSLRDAYIGAVPTGISTPRTYSSVWNRKHSRREGDSQTRMGICPNDTQQLSQPQTSPTTSDPNPSTSGSCHFGSRHFGSCHFLHVSNRYLSISADIKVWSHVHSIYKTEVMRILKTHTRWLNRLIIV